MLLAKLALGFSRRIFVAGADTFHEGVMRVDADNPGGPHIHVWVPAAIVPMAMHVVPRRHFDHAIAQVGPWLPTLRALAKELKKYPETELVGAEDGKKHIRIRTHHGRLLIDVTEPGEDVHVACPLALIEDLAVELEATSPP